MFTHYFSTIGGGEKVVLAMAETLNADIYTTSISVPYENMGSGRISISG